MFGDKRQAVLGARRSDIQPPVYIDETDIVTARCPFCCVMQDNLKRCNSCHQYIPPDAVCTRIKSNGLMYNITKLNPICSNYPAPPPEHMNRVIQYHHKTNPLQPQIPVFFHHPDKSFRENLKEIARTAIHKQRNNEETIEERKRKRCSFDKCWRYCSRCNPEMSHLNESDDRKKCTKDDLRKGLKFIMDHMQFSEKKPKKSEQGNKMKKSVHHHYKGIGSESDDYSSGSEEQNTDIILKVKKKNNGFKTYVASKKLSDTAVKKSKFMTSTKTVGITPKNKDTDSLQSVNVIKKQKSAEVTVMAPNKLHNVIDKNIQCINKTKFVSISHNKNYDSSSNKLNNRNGPQVKSGMIKSTKLFYARGKEGQLINRAKTDGVSESKYLDSPSLRKQNMNINKLDINVAQTEFKLPFPIDKKGQFMTTSKNVFISEASSYQRPHPIKTTFVQKIISNNGATTSKNIQVSSSISFCKNMNLNVNNLNSLKNKSITVLPACPGNPSQTSSNTSLDHKKTNLDRNNIIPIKDENKTQSTQSSSEKFSNTSKSIDFNQKETSMNADNLHSIKSKNMSTVILSSSKKIPELSTNLTSDKKESNLDAKSAIKNENKITAMPSLSRKLSEEFNEDANKCEAVSTDVTDENCQLSTNLTSDKKESNLDAKSSIKNENKITAIPSLSRKLSEEFNEDANKCEAISKDVTDENCQNAQLPLKKLEYPGLSQKDLACLPERNLINDTIIEFYLKYIFNEKLTPELQEKTYICNPFFYPKVLKQLNDTDQKKAKSVESWLKDIDLFSKDFILIPVNVKNAKVKHWYLVIICFLSKIQKMPLYNADSGTTVHNDGKRTCICFFDSACTEKKLSKEKMNVAKNFKNFLKKLWLSNHKYEICDWTQLIPFNILCPQQHNEHDCGIFLLQFAQSFFQTPIAKFEDQLSVTHWCNQDTITEKRKEIKKIIEERITKM